jgi:mRNA interferase RelE/StbE
VRHALAALQTEPTLGTPLRNELEGLWRYRVRRYRIVYGIERSSRQVRVVAVGPRRAIYDALAESRRPSKT